MTEKMNIAPKIILLLLLVAGIAAADVGNSSTYRLAIQENNLNSGGNSTNFNLTIDSPNAPAAGIGNTTSYRIYLGLVSFLAKFDELPIVDVALSSFAGEPFVFQGTTARFQLTVKNTGNRNSEIAPRLYIYDSSGALAFQRTGSSVTLEGSSTVSLLQYSTLTFSVGTIAPGIYNATANILYTDARNMTQVTANKSILFEIKAVSTSTTTPGGGTTGGGGSVIQNITKPGRVEFTEIPVLIELKNGEENNQVISIRNPSGKAIKNLKIYAEGIPDSWIYINNPLINIDPYGASDISVLVQAPAEAPPGNYITRITASNDDAESSFSFLLRVVNPLNPTEKGGSEPLFVSKIATADTQKENTFFTLKVKNGNKFAKKISVVEKIEKSIAASSDDIVFLTQPSKIIQRDPEVEWTFNDVNAYEERNITYYVNKVVNTTKSFVYSSVEQTAVFNGLPPAPPTVPSQAAAQEFKVDYTTFNTAMLLALAAFGIFGMYKLEHHIRKRIYLKGIQHFIGMPIMTAETGRKLGVVDDVTFMPMTGELLDIVIKKPTPYARRLLTKRGTERLYVPFQSVKAIGDYVVITEKDIVFEAVLQKRAAPETKEIQAQTKVNQFYKLSRVIKVKPSDTIATNQKEKSQPAGAYSGFNVYDTKKPTNVRAQLKEMKKLYREGVIDEKTYKSAKKRLLEGLGIMKDGHESLANRIKKKIEIITNR